MELNDLSKMATEYDDDDGDDDDDHDHDDDVDVDERERERDTTLRPNIRANSSLKPEKTKGAHLHLDPHVDPQ